MNNTIYNYRLYSFTNMYLSDIQKGIQTAHAIGDMFSWYKNVVCIDQWATVDKTIIVLNGGNAKSLWKISDLFHTYDNIYPFVTVCEDEESLNNVITAVAILLPEKVYSGKGKSRTKWDKQLYKFLQNYHLA